MGAVLGDGLGWTEEGDKFKVGDGFRFCLDGGKGSCEIEWKKTMK